MRQQNSSRKRLGVMSGRVGIWKRLGVTSRLVSMRMQLVATRRRGGTRKLGAVIDGQVGMQTQ